MFFKNWKTRTASPQWIIAGLGNPGKKYGGTRHNIGFDALDFAASRWGIDIKRAKFDALYGTGQVAGQEVLLLKPQTFMNLSGPSLQKAGDYYDIPVERMLVLFDDVSLPPGVLRIRLSGSAGGHNGLKSLIAFLGEDFPRVKIGVGDRPRPEYSLADWVLSRFTQAERKAIEDRFPDVQKACELLLQDESTQAMSRYNGTGHAEP
ncbi:aminoacyl-tRNA hydrolase [Ruminococcaceae bacterium OttesenSCG-928-I18]|nr:aminoacyl-tRNA hydrolase [Ruminococcaceae bacterium OttesenSCG-928-I18]